MNLEAFTDELLRLHGEPQGLTKAAKKSTSLFLPFAAIGGAAGLGKNLYRHGKAAVTGNPWDKPWEPASQSAMEGALGGLTAAGILKLIGRFAKKGKR